MLVRLACCVALAAAMLMPHGARAQNCAEEISKLMSKDTEKLTTRYQRITKQIQEKGASAEAARRRSAASPAQLGPRLEDQLAAHEAVRLRQGPADGQHDRRHRPRP